jgi:hypothetical protein
MSLERDNSEEIKSKKHKFEINPLGRTKKYHLLEEKVRRYTPDSTDYEWFEVDSWSYLCKSEKSLEDLMRRVFERRIKEGWIPDKDSEEYPESREFNIRKGNDKFTLHYEWGEINLVINDKNDKT